MVGTVPLELNRLLRAPDTADREAAWEQLIAGHTRLLMSVARSLGGDHDSAMERYSYILEKLREDDFRRLRSYKTDSGASFSTWLTVTARHLSLDCYRARYGRHRPVTDPDKSVALRAVRRMLSDSISSEIDADSISDSARAPDRGLVIDYRDQCLQDEISRLPARDRLIISLRFEDGLSASRIARVIGLATPFHVYRNLNSILGRLRDALKARGIENSDG